MLFGLLINKTDDIVVLLKHSSVHGALHFRDRSGTIPNSKKEYVPHCRISNMAEIDVPVGFVRVRGDRAVFWIALQEGH